MGQPIVLTAPQTRLFTSKAKATAFVGGFGSGKSQALFTKMLTTKLAFPNNTIGYFAPSYSLIRDIAYPRMEEILNNTTLRWKLNKSDNNISIEGNSKILFRTMDDPSRIIGFEIKDAFIDELDTLSYANAKEAWEKILARTRQKARSPIRKGVPGNQLFVGTTPEGFRFVWKQWVDLAPPGYLLIKAATSSNPHLPEDYVETLKSSYPDNLIEAYLNGEFVNLTGSMVYASYDRILNRTNRTIQPYDELHCGVDFNVNNMSLIINVKDADDDYSPRAVKEHTKLKDTIHLINILNEYRDKGHAMYVYPDASGKSTKTIDASKSDLSILRDNGFRLRVNHNNPPVKDRIIAMNTQLCDANKRRRMLVNDSECPDFANALERQVYLPNGQPEKDRATNVDDCNDAEGYFIYHQYHVDRPKFASAQVAHY